MSGYVVVQAESHEAAAKMFENHPHFTIFPGDSVEIMECCRFLDSHNADAVSLASATGAMTADQDASSRA